MMSEALSCSNRFVCAPSNACKGCLIVEVLAQRMTLEREPLDVRTGRLDISAMLLPRAPSWHLVWMLLLGYLRRLRAALWSIRGSV